MRKSNFRHIALAVFIVAVCGGIFWIFAAQRGGAPEAPSAPAEEAPSQYDSDAAAPTADAGATGAADTEVPGDVSDDVLPIDPLEDMDMIGDIEKRERERFEEAKAALLEELKQVKPLTNQEIGLLEQFIEEFGISIRTGWVVTMLAERYGHLQRYDDARALYGRLMGELPEAFVSLRHHAAFELAQMEARAGNLDAAEKVLKDVMQAPAPSFTTEWERESFDVAVNVEAALKLADVYTRQRRAEEARVLLDGVIAFARSMPPDHTDFGNVPYHMGRAYRQRAELILDEADEAGLDDAMDAALGLIARYAGEFEGAPLREHSRNYMSNYQDHLRIVIANRTWNRKIDFLFSRTAAGDLDADVEQAHALINEYRTLYDDHQWHSQSSADEFRRSAGWMEKRVERLAQKKRAGD